MNWRTALGAVLIGALSACGADAPAPNGTGFVELPVSTTVPVEPADRGARLLVDGPTGPLAMVVETTTTTTTTTTIPLPTDEERAYCEQALTMVRFPQGAGSLDSTRAAIDAELVAMTELLPPRAFADVHLGRIAWLRAVSGLVEASAEGWTGVSTSDALTELEATPAVADATAAHVRLLNETCVEILAGPPDTVDEETDPTDG